MMLTYITIYFIKLSFLFFFRILVRRDHKMMIYWWTTFAILIIALFLSLVMAIIPISIFAFSTSTVDHIFIDWAAGGAALDIATDILRKFDSHVEQTHFIKTYQIQL